MAPGTSYLFCNVSHLVSFLGQVSFLSLFISDRWGRRVAGGDAASVPPIYRKGCRRRIREIAAMICLGRMQNWRQVRPPSVAALRANKNEHNNNNKGARRLKKPLRLPVPARI